MSLFQNSFLSFSGQVERLQNVGRTLNAVVNPWSEDYGSVTGTTSSKTFNALAEFAADHPLATAAIVAPVTGALPGAPAAAQAGAAAARSSIVAGINGLSTKTKVISAILAPAIAGTLIHSEKARVGAIKGADTLVNGIEGQGKLGSDIGNFIESPSWDSAKQAIQNNPEAAIVAGTAIGVGAAGAVLGIVEAGSRTMNTLAIENASSKFSDAANKLDNTLSSAPSVPAASPTGVTTPANVPPLAVISTPAGGVTPSHRKKYKRDSFGRAYGFNRIKRVRTQYIYETKAPPCRKAKRSLHPAYCGQAKRSKYEKDTLYEERATLRAFA